MTGNERFVLVWMEDKTSGLISCLVEGGREGERKERKKKKIQGKQTSPSAQQLLLAFVALQIDCL